MEVIVGLGLFVWLVYLLCRAIRYATDVAKRVAHGSLYCRVCGEPNARLHGCHISAVARQGKAIKGGYQMRNGMVKRWRWEGYVDDRLGKVWRCRHNHWTREEAKACATAQVRRFQLTGEGLPQVALPRPETFPGPKRLPITDL